MCRDSVPVMVFDLDDTLYKEHTYTYSCFVHVCEKMSYLSQQMVSVDDLVKLAEAATSDPIKQLGSALGLSSSQCDSVIGSMQSHSPAITLPESSAFLLSILRARQMPFAIITDGRSCTQRAKIEALHLEDASLIRISEEVGVGKPDERAFVPVMKKFPDRSYVYIADNPKKDFIAPNALAWSTVMLMDDGTNIHSQKIDVDEAHCAKYTVDSLRDIVELFQLHK